MDLLTLVPVGYRTRAPSVNVIGDELLLNFGPKFQRYFVISHVKLQNCHGKPAVRLRFKMATKF